MKNQQNGSTSFKDAYNKAKGAAPVAQSQKKVINVIDIDESFSQYTKENPYHNFGYALWVNTIGKLICLRDADLYKKNAPFYTFFYEPGTVHIVSGASKYVFFRGRTFQDFLEKYGIDRVIKADPNGEYQAREGVNRYWQNNFSIVTDGEVTELPKSNIFSSEEPVIGMKFANAYFRIKNATFALFTQRSMKLENDTVTQITQLVTSSDVMGIGALLDKMNLNDEVEDATNYVEPADQVDKG